LANDMNVMKRALSLVLFIAVVSLVAGQAAAQDSSSAPQTVEALRAQLLDVQAKEAELQARERQLEEDLKPENIERSLAGIGSTRPEELRESRRRQLTIERDGVRAQLKLVTASRERLEAVIRTAETQAYQQSAEGSPLLNQAVAANKSWSSRWLIAVIFAFGELLGIGILVFKVMKRARTT
jgi:cell division protein FtsB